MWEVYLVCNNEWMSVLKFPSRAFHSNVILSIVADFNVVAALSVCFSFTIVNIPYDLIVALKNCFNRNKSLIQTLREKGFTNNQ